MYASADAMSADREGLLFGNGADVKLTKKALSFDWRDAASVKAGGFFSVKTDIPQGSTLLFAAAREPGTDASVEAVLTFVAAGSPSVLWRAGSADLDDTKWRDFTVTLPPAAASGELVFEASQGSGGILFANPRIAAAPASKPNVLLLVVDTLRADHLSLYGAPRPTSPEVDARAASAVVFDDCIASGPWTLPSMGALFTSLAPTAHGMLTMDSGLSPYLTTLPERFRSAGYFTGAVQGNALLAAQQGIGQGFNSYLYLAGNVWNADDKGRYASAQAVNAAALDWLSVNASSPFFLYLHYMDPHKPYPAVEGYDKFRQGRPRPLRRPDRLLEPALRPAVEGARDSRPALQHHNRSHERPRRAVPRAWLHRPRRRASRRGAARPARHVDSRRHQRRPRLDPRRSG